MLPFQFGTGRQRQTLPQLAGIVPQLEGRSKIERGGLRIED